MKMIVNPYIPIGPKTILECAQWHYGPSAQLWPNPNGHAYGFQARKPNDNTRYNLDLQAFTATRYNKDWRVVQTGWSASGWAWFNPFQRDHIIIPVVLVAKDKVWLPPNELDAAMDVYYKNCLAVADWYGLQMWGKKPGVAKPIAFHSDLSSQQWIDMYLSQADRFDTWKYCQAELMKRFGNRINSSLLYSCTQYLGAENDYDYDAAGGGWLSTVSSFATLHQYDSRTTNQRAKTVAYALAHEWGHPWGLPHTDPTLGNATGIERAVMKSARLPEAILVPYEKQRLVNNPFFS